MIESDLQFPGYGFADHKGYGTAAHAAALKSKGVTSIHRRSFAPIAELLLNS
jgi:ribonuclease HII